MSDSRRVLCLSADPTRLAHLREPLERSYPDVRVLTAESTDEAIGVLESATLDCLVADYRTAVSDPAVFAVAREHFPELTLVLVSPYETDVTDGVAVAQVVDFLDPIDGEGSAETFSGWVANAVVGEGSSPGRPAGNSIQETVREVKQALADATSPVDIEHAVAEQLTAGGRYQFVWIGEHDRGERQVVPWVSSTAGESWPLSQTFTVGTSGENTVVEATLRSDTPQFVNLETATDAPWRTRAVEEGCTEAAFLPLSTENDRFGVMGVYTDTAGGFDEMERSALREIASTTSYVLETMAIRGRIEQQERTLRRYERLVETVGDGMYALDDQGHFMTVNDALCSMTGFSREGILGEHIGIVLDDADRETTEAAIEQLRSDEIDTVTHEIALQPKHDEPFPCENQLALLDDEVDGCVGVIRDVTDRKRRERQLREQNERLEAFAEIVSHDLRNPLTVAQGYLDLLGEEADQTAVEEITLSLDRMESIISDVLTLAQDDDHTETSPHEFEAVVEDGWSNVETNDASLAVTHSRRVKLHRSQTLRLLENLFRNAIEHGDDAVTVTAGLFEDDDGTVGFYIADDGPGIDEDLRETALDGSFTDDADGFGIGLWVVTEIADAHGWTPSVTDSQSGGARFEFRGLDVVE